MSSPTSPFAPAQPATMPAQPTNRQEANPAIVELRNFLANAPRLWKGPNDAPVRKFKMSNGEEISCVFWKGRFFITGTDVVKILIFRFQLLGRNILNPKKFEEGVFSDLRNLKPGTDAVLEEPRSEFLEFLHKHGCIRTQKKQKVFFWHKVPHEDLFREALERNLKRATNAFSLSALMSSPEMVRNVMMVAHGQMGMMPGGVMLPQNGAQMFIPGQQASPFMGQFPSPQAVAMGNPMLYGNGGSPAASRPQPAAHPQQATHPRRTISLSHVDFTQPPSNGAAPGSPMLPPGFDIASALSSPMFSPADVEINESFFDVNPAALAGSKTSADPMMGTVAPSDVMAPEVMAPDVMASDVMAADDPTAPKDQLEPDVLVDALSPAGTLPNELMMDPALGDLTGNELLGDIWSGEKVGSMNSPLWDDLTMVVPNSAPNLRDME